MGLVVAGGVEFELADELAGVDEDADELLGYGWVARGARASVNRDVTEAFGQWGNGAVLEDLSRQLSKAASETSATTFKVIRGVIVPISTAATVADAVCNLTNPVPRVLTSALNYLDDPNKGHGGRIEDTTQYKEMMNSGDPRHSGHPGGFYNAGSPG